LIDMSISDPKFRKLDSTYYKHEIPSISLDYYEPDSHGNDDFSRKLVWFYVYGDEELATEFKESLTDLFRDYIQDSDTEWDLMTLYPTSNKAGINTNLRDVFTQVSEEVGIPMTQVLERIENVEESHNLDNEKAKVVNVEGSVEVTQNLDGKNVILVDNIILSGTSLLHGASKLKEYGAENVLAVSLGTDKNRQEKTREIKEGRDITKLIGGIET
jgi:phosphoribosylpyrophosphate synthetase